MTLEELEKLFEENDDVYGEFDKISPKRKFNNRPDLNAFLILDQLQPSSEGMITVAEHDEYWLNIDVEKILPKLTPEIVLDLIRCGMFYDTSTESFNFMT